jgi:hypothetical protein
MKKKLSYAQCLTLPCCCGFLQPLAMSEKKGRWECLNKVIKVSLNMFMTIMELGLVDFCISWAAA